MRERKSLMDKISKLGETEHQEIYKILQTNGINYTQNNNGVFFNLTTLSDEVFKEIEKFVFYCHENKVELDEYDQKLNECKYMNNINQIVKNPKNVYFSSINEPITKKERIQELFEEVDKTNIVKDFVEKINTNVEKAILKRSGTKYAMAKKKFLRKLQNDIDIQDELELEDY
jgi:hypothetical protein